MPVFYCSLTEVATGLWVKFFRLWCLPVGDLSLSLKANTWFLSQLRLSDTLSICSPQDAPNHEVRHLLWLGVVNCCPFAEASLFIIAILSKLPAKPLTAAICPFIQQFMKYSQPSGRTWRSATVLNALLALSRCPFRNPISKYMQFMPDVRLC